jgi:hypothetical protein
MDNTMQQMGYGCNSVGNKKQHFPGLNFGAMPPSTQETPQPLETGFK